MINDLDNFMPGCRNEEERRREFRKHLYDNMCSSLTLYDTTNDASFMYEALCTLQNNWDYIYEEDQLPARWIKPLGMMMPPEFHGRHCCSNCGHIALYSWSHREELSRHCPNCGKEMINGVDE